MFTVCVALVVIFLAGITVPRVLRDAALSDAQKSAILSEGIPGALHDFLAGPDTAMADALAFEVDLVPERLDFDYGLSYLGTIGRPVPRSIWTDKPDAADQKLNEALFPSSYQRRTGVSFSWFGESWLALGSSAEVAISAVVGLVGWLAWRWYLRCPNDPVRIAATAVWVPYAIVFFRGSFSADLHRLVLVAAPVILVALLARNRSAEAGSSC